MLIRAKLPNGKHDLPPEIWAEHLIGIHGGAWAAELLAKTRASIHEERRRMDEAVVRASSGPAEYGVALTAEELGEANAALERVEEIAATLEGKLVEWRRLADDFAVDFEHEAALTARLELDASSTRVEDEARRYEDPEYGEGELAMLVERASELAALHHEGEHARRAHFEATITAGPFMDQVRRLTPGHAARVAGLEAAVQKAERAFNLARADAEDDHPILAAYTSGPGIENLIAIANEGPDEVKARLRATIDEKREAIAEVREALERDSSLVWEFPSLLENTLEVLGFEEDSIAARLLKDHLEDRAREETTREVALGMGVLALGAASVFTMGTSGVAATGIGGKLLLGTSVAANGAMAVRDLERYQRASAARSTDFDTARALTREVPSLFWLALGIAAVGLEVGAATGVFARLKGPAQAAMLAEGPEALGARAALAKELEAAHIAPNEVLESLDVARAAARSGPGTRLSSELDLARDPLTEAFGSDAAVIFRLLGRHQRREFAQEGVLGRLAAAERGPVLALLGKRVSPVVIDEVLTMGERLQPGTGAAVLRYLAGQHVDEVSTARAMLKLELEDGGHAVLRHGPHLESAVLEARLKTGVTPDGLPSRAPASTRFRSFRMMKRAYEDARRLAKKAHGVDLKCTPGIGGNGPDGKCTVVIDYGKPVSRGFLKSGEAHLVRVKAPAGGEEAVKVWGAVRPSDELVTRVKATFEWDGARWRVVQLFPDSSHLNPATGLYDLKADKYWRNPR